MTDFSRYARQTQIAEIGLDGQRTLNQASVLIVGVGGLGCTVATYLTGAGIGQLVLADHDTIALSNLHRQTLFSEPDIGDNKATVALRELRQRNSSVALTAHPERLTPSNAHERCADCDLIIDAADNFATAYLLSDVCQELDKPLLSASVNRTFGYIGLFCDGSPSFRAAFPKLPQQQTSCDAVGVTGPSVGAIASIQAQEAIKVLLGQPSLAGKLLYVDLWRYSQHMVDFSSAKEPDSDSFTLIDQAAISDDDFVVDVRSAEEVAAQPQSFRVDRCVALNELTTDTFEPSDKRIVVACQSGQRAIMAAQTLCDLGHNNVAALLPDQ